MNILVTGGAGYIGSHTCLALKELGYKTVVLDTLERGHLAAVIADVFVRGDIGDVSLVKDLLTKHNIEAVMHFSAYTYVEESVRKPSMYFRNNVVATINLLDAMLECDVKKFVFSSTCAIYGQPDIVPIAEDAPQNPLSPYGFTKMAVERALDAYSQAYGLSFAALRYFNAAGADAQGRLGEDHRPETHAIPLLLDAAAGLRPGFKVFGTDYDTPDGSCIRDYIHVMDLADAHIRALKLLDSEKAVKLNLGTTNGVSVLELVEAVKRVTGQTFDVEFCGRRPGDPAKLVGSNTAARDMLGWAPKHSDLNTIIETAWKWKLANPQGYIN